MKTTISAFLAVVLLVCVFSTEAPARAQNEKSEMERLKTAVQECVDAWNRIDVGRMLECYAEDATFMPQDAEMLRGKKAIREYFSGPWPEKVNFKRDIVELKIEGILAYEIVNQIVTIQMKGQEPKTAYNKVIHIWKKQKDGSWKILIDMFNSRPEPR